MRHWPILALVSACGIPAGIPAEPGPSECTADVDLELCLWSSLATAGVVGTISQVRLVRDPCIGHEPGRVGRTVQRIAPPDTTEGTYALEVSIDVDDVLFGEVEDRVVVRFVEELWSPLPTGFYYRDGLAASTVDDVHWIVNGDLLAGTGRLVPGVKLGMLLASIPGESWFTKVRPFMTVDDAGLLGAIPSGFSNCTVLLPPEISGATPQSAREALANCELSGESIFAGLPDDARFDVDLGTCELPRVGSP
ncbi:MAG: hypothetical protein Q8O67_25570 [Deltaproteobacteria bacterium]|nr:hypothetical protein [Deltaproteobacteria bacterium]